DVLAVQLERRAARRRVAGAIHTDGHRGAAVDARLVELTAELVDAEPSTLRLHRHARSLSVGARRIDGDQRVALLAADTVAHQAARALDDVTRAAQDLAERGLDLVLEVTALGGAPLALL